MSRRRSTPGGFVSSSTLPRGPGGRPLCRRCSTEVTGRRQTFCSDACVHEWKIRTQPGYLRLLAKRRDHGVCDDCELDTEALWLSYARTRDALPLRDDELALLKGKMRRWRHSSAAVARVALLGFDPYRSTWWDADHIVPVVEGGGECDLANIRTLCIPCHRRATAALAHRRAEARKAAGQVPLFEGDDGSAR